MFAEVFKDSEASRKAWLKRSRGLQHGGKGVGWLHEDGSPLDDKTQAAIKRLKSPIPPAWTGVKVSLDPKSAVIAEGTDVKGRTQKMYSTEHTQGAAAAKFARVAELHKHIPKLLSQSTADMLNTKLSARERDNAATVNLITKTGFRPGSPKDTGAAEQAFGASTLQKRHIKLAEGGKIKFAFVGKKGVSQAKNLQDDDTHKYLSEKLPGMKPSEQVFKTSGASAMAYMRQHTGSQFKIKDLRTWNGTTLATHLLKGVKPPKDAAADKALRKKISTLVSEHLGNTPKIAHDSYINPAVWPTIGNMKAVKAK
jgi:DNA topoisomerase-1